MFVWWAGSGRIGGGAGVKQASGMNVDDERHSVETNRINFTISTCL